MKEIKQYSRVRLKDGREGTVIEIFGEQEQFLVDTEKPPESWETIDVKKDEIAEVIE